MRFGSVCSGIEAASAAWHPLGWEAAWFSEIEPFPCAVLAHHYPEVPNHGDMTKLPQLICSGEVEAPDLFCGGTPCQAFSVAGLRRSLDDARGNLSLTFCEIADAIDAVRRAGGKPASIVFWENVPGVLSTSDNAFGCFLGALAGCDTAIEPLAATGWTDAGVVAGPQRTVAWRVLDAQYFGLAQRRRRVFVVASARDDFNPAAVLLEWEGLRRDSAPSREAGQRVAPTIAGCANGGGANGPGRDVDIVESLQVMSTGQANAEVRTDGGAPTLTCLHEAPIVAHALTASRSSTQCPTEDTTLVPMAHAFDARQSDVLQYGDKTGPLDTDGHSIGVMQPVGVTLHGTDGTQSVASLTDLSSSLRSRIPSGVENSTTTAVMQPVTYDLFNVTAPVNRQNRQPGDPCHTLARSNAEHAVVLAPTLTASNDPSRSPQSSEITAQVAAVVQATAAVALQDVRAMNKAQNGRGWNDDGMAYTVDTHATQGVAVWQATSMQVRRLTPVECERLQGFPDGYTAIPWRNKPASDCPDGPRYKALGNSWAVPVVRWIGERINAVTAAPTFFD